MPRAHRAMFRICKLVLGVTAVGALSPVLAGTSTWIGGASGGPYWDLDNWNVNPTDGSSAVLGAFDTDFRTGSLALTEFSGTGTLTISGGTLTVSSQSTTGGLDLTGGILAGKGSVDAGALNVTGDAQIGMLGKNTPEDVTLNVSGATSITPAGALSITSGSTVNLDGNTAWSGTSIDITGPSLTSGTASTLTIGKGANFTDTGADAYGRSFIGDPNSAGMLNIEGTYTRNYTNGFGVTFIEATVNNTGTLNVASGYIQLEAGCISTGQIAISSGGLLTMANNYTNVFSGALSNSGTLGIGGGTLILSGRYSGAGTIDDESTLVVNTTITPGVLSLFGVLSGSGTVTAGSFNSQYGGQIGTYGNTTAGVSLNVSGTASIVTGSPGSFGITGGSTVNLNGTTVWLGAGESGNLYIDGPYKGTGATSTLTIGKSGTFIAEGSNGVASYHFAGGIFNNEGSFVEATDNGRIDIETTFNNTGVVHVDPGVLKLSGGGVSTGAFLIEPASILEFSGGTSTLTGDVIDHGTLAFSGGTTTLTGVTDIVGTLAISGGSATLNGNNYNMGVLTISGGALTINGPIAPSGVAVTGGLFNANAPVTAGRLSISGGTLAGAGTVTVGALGADGGEIGIHGNPSGGVLNSNGVASINGANAFIITGASAVNLNGATTWSSGGAGISVDGPIQAGATASTLTIGPNGTFTDQNSSGTRAIGIYDTAGGILTNRGTYLKTGAGTTDLSQLTYNNPGTTNVVAGTLNLPSNFTNTGTLEGSGTLYTAGTVTNDHQVSPGSSASAPGQLTLTGNYVQGTNGFLDIGATGTVNGFLKVSGSATLAGTIDVGCVGSCTYSAGQQLLILNSSHLTVDPTAIVQSGFTGTNDFSLLTQGNEEYLVVDQNVTALVGDHNLTAAVPEPGTYAMIFAGLGAIGAVARRRRTAAA